MTQAPVAQQEAPKLQDFRPTAEFSPNVRATVSPLTTHSMMLELVSAAFEAKGLMGRSDPMNYTSGNVDRPAALATENRLDAIKAADGQYAIAA